MLRFIFQHEVTLGKPLQWQDETGESTPDRHSYKTGTIAQMYRPVVTVSKGRWNHSCGFSRVGLCRAQ